MTLEDDGDLIITSIFETFIGNIQDIVKLYGINRAKFPSWAQLFVTDKMINDMIGFIKDNVHDIPRYLKIEIAAKVKQSLEHIDDMYVSSVIHGKPNKFLGETLTRLDVMKFNGV